MWMMGYHDDFNMPDSFNGRKLRPLIPRPAPSSPTPAPSITRIHAPDHFFALNHHLASMAEQGKREGASGSVVVSSRWNPTPEQLRTLEELYRRGTRTPSADQIQHITAQLRRYGKIEGKNVFYWFQNHKARERQKRRRQMECPNGTSPQQDHHHHHHHHHHDNVMLQTNKDNNNNNNSISISSPSGGGGGGSRVAGVEGEGEQNKNCSTHVHCTTTPPEPEPEPEPEEANSKAATGMAECTRDDGWVQYEHRELQQQHIMNMMRRNATWHSMQLPCPLPSPRVSSTVPIPTIFPTKTLNLHHHHHQQDYLNIFIHNDHHHQEHQDLDQELHDHHDHDQTLELFPLRSESAAAPADHHCTNQKTNANNNNQFFEFLPLKN